MPKRQLRPFNCQEYNFLNDETVIYPGKTIKFEIFIFITILSTIIFSTGLIILLGVYYSDNIDFSVWTNYYPWFLPLEYTLLVLTLISTVLYLLLDSTQEVTFNSENNLLSIPIDYSKNTFTATWEDWTARVYEHNDTLEFSIVFIHLPTLLLFNPVNRTTNLNILLSFWSFIVAFMDNTKPITAFKENNNNIDLQCNWKYYYENLKINDPWLDWVEEFNSNSNLDTVNNLVTERYYKK